MNQPINQTAQQLQSELQEALEVIQRLIMIYE